MIKKILLFLVLASMAYLPLSGSEGNAKDDGYLARINWNININTGFYPCYVGPYYYYPYPPCAYPYPPPYWMW